MVEPGIRHLASERGGQIPARTTDRFEPVSRDHRNVSAVIKLSSPATREFWEIPVLFEDDHLLALDKPAGLLTSPDTIDLARPSLMKLLHSAIAAKKPWAAERQLDYLHNSNFLDFGATGVLLLAKNKPAFIALANLASA